MIEKSVKIDWLSFTFPVPDEFERQDRTYWRYVMEALAQQIPPDVFDHMWNALAWSFGGGQRPYSESLRVDTRIAVFADIRNPYALMQVTGQGCAVFRDMGVMERIVEAVKSRVTRIDIACDFICDVQPDEFVQAGISARFRARGTDRSATGHTEYIGSPKSDLRCRVYRYYEPHPRAKNLRVEFQIRGDEAKNYAASLSTNDADWVARALWERFGFESRLIGVGKTASVENVISGNRTQNGTLRWLLVQVQPAFIRLVREGLIENPAQFLEDHFLNPALEEMSEI